MKPLDNEIYNMKQFFILFIFTLILSSCGAKKTTHTPRKSSKKEKLVRIYSKYKHTPYRYGGTNSNGFDCSGFVQKVYQEAFNIKIPRTTRKQISIGKKVSKKNYQLGDLLFFKPSKKYYHVGIYVGDNSFIHSASSSGVSKTKLNNPYWKKHYLQARRVLRNN